MADSNPLVECLVQLACTCLCDDSCPAPCRMLGLLILFALGCLGATAYLFSAFGPMPGGIMLAGAVCLLVFLYLCVYIPYLTRLTQRGAGASQQRGARPGAGAWDRPTSKFGNLTAPPDEVAPGHPISKSLTAPWHPSNVVTAPYAVSPPIPATYGSARLPAGLPPPPPHVVPYYAQPSPHEEAAPRFSEQRQWPSAQPK
jgi:hypothetical protein